MSRTRAAMPRIIAFAVVALTGLSISTATAATFDVTRADDPAANGCIAADCSLREAIEAAAVTGEADLIRLAAGQYRVTQGELVVEGSVEIAGLGSESTSLVGIGEFTLLRVSTFSDLILTDMELSAVEGISVGVDDRAAATLRFVNVTDGLVGTIANVPTSGSADVRIEHSQITALVGFALSHGALRITDSSIYSVIVYGNIDLDLQRVVVDGDLGVTVYGLGPISISDSTIRNSSSPINLGQPAGDAADVHVRRTRFIDNHGPLLSSRAAGIYLDDVEFRDNSVDAEHMDEPSVLRAAAGSAWRINRALFAGNRGGGGLDGATIRALSGGNVVITNSTFVDNTFHDDVASGYSDTIGVYTNQNLPTLLWLVHVTMRRAASIPEDAPASLLTVRGPFAQVSVFNSVLHGTCGFGGGGALDMAFGNIESAGDTCGMDEATNRVDMNPILLELGQLADHGGFTETFMPNRASALLNSANPGICLPVDQRGYLRPQDQTECDVGATEAGGFDDLIFANDFE